MRESKLIPMFACMATVTGAFIMHLFVKVILQLHGIRSCYLAAFTVCVHALCLSCAGKARDQDLEQSQTYCETWQYDSDGSTYEAMIYSTVSITPW